MLVGRVLLLRLLMIVLLLGGGVVCLVCVIGRSVVVGRFACAHVGAIDKRFYFAALCQGDVGLALLFLLQVLCVGLRLCGCTYA